MPKMDAQPVAIPDLSPEHHSPLFNLRALQREANTLLERTPHPRRTEISELLHRHYEDKSLIDEWTSWCYDLSFWQKSGITISTIGIAGLSGVVLGLTFPFIVIASSILYATLTLLSKHEEHRRERGARFAKETAALATQLDELLSEFRRIGTEMTTALEQVDIQAKEMLEQNTAIRTRTIEHHEEHSKLKSIIAVVNEQSERTQHIQNHVLTVTGNITSELQLIRPQIDEARHAVHDFQGSMEKFAETTAMIHSAETRFNVISNGLQACIHRMSTSRPEESVKFDSEIQTILRASQLELEKTNAFFVAAQDDSPPNRLIMRT